MTRSCLIGLLLLSLVACGGAPLHPHDSALGTTGEIVWRTFWGIVTVGMSEVLLNENYRALQGSVPLTQGTGLAPGAPRHRVFVVLSNSNVAANAAEVFLQKRGARVIERAQVEKVLAEQAFILRYSPDAQADRLRVGALLGADAILFVEAALDGDWVAVRAVNVESGMVVWAGHAKSRYRSLLSGPSDVAWLTDWALARATCPPGWWHEVESWHPEQTTGCWGPAHEAPRSRPGP